MPRLGGDVPSNRGVDSRRNTPAMAYQQGRNRFPISNVMLLLFFTFILRNMFFHDYKKEEVSALKASGKSAEEISKMVPQSGTERRQTVQERKAEYETLKMDVKSLKKEVERLKAKLGEDSEEVFTPDGEDEESEGLADESDHEPPEESAEDEEVEVEEEEEGVEEIEVEEEEEVVVKPKPVASHAKLRKTVKKKAAPTPVKKTAPVKKTVKKKVPAEKATTKKITKKKTIRKKPKLATGGVEPPIEA